MFTIRWRDHLLARGLLVATLAVVSSVLTASPAGADATRLSASEQRAIERVVRDQLDAFGQDDARRAFGHASPEIQRQFGTPDNFLRMVRDNYDPVYRSSGVQFESTRRVGRNWVQTVQMFDQSGHVWRALFTMKRAAKNTWKVAGCRLVETSSLAV